MESLTFNGRYIIQFIEVNEGDGGFIPACPDGMYFDQSLGACVPNFDGFGDDDNDDSFAFRRIVSGYLPINDQGNLVSAVIENLRSDIPIAVLGNNTQHNQGVYVAYGSILHAYAFNCTHYDDEFDTDTYPGDVEYDPSTIVASGNVQFSDWLKPVQNVSEDRRQMVEPTAPGGGGNSMYSTTDPCHMAEFLGGVIFDLTLYPEADANSNEASGGPVEVVDLTGTFTEVNTNNFGGK